MHRSWFKRGQYQGQFNVNSKAFPTRNHNNLPKIIAQIEIHSQLELKFSRNFSEMGNFETKVLSYSNILTVLFLFDVLKLTFTVIFGHRLLISHKAHHIKIV